jgi:two-component system LytT family sensor kinase
MGSKDDIPFQQNLGIIQPLLENLSITYESWIKYVNSSGAYIYTPINKQQCNFCRLIRSHPVGYQRCRETAQKCVYLNPKKHHLFSCQCSPLIGLDIFPLF